jgi:endonuclease G, mitochondrial
MKILRTAALLLLPSLAFAQYYAGLTPTCTKTQKVWSYSSSTTYYAVGWSDTTHTALWSAFTVAPTASPTTTCTRPSSFASESRESPVITDNSYTGTGYDRGHMVPNAAMAYWRGCTASNATFITSNLCPQIHGFNAGVWEKLESMIAGLNGGSSFTNGLIQKGRTVWVYCGPVVATGDATVGSAKLDVAKKFWKTVIWKDATGAIKTCSWMFNHDATIPSANYMSYTTTIRAIQTATGLTLVAAGSALLDQKDSAAFTTAAK